MSFQANNKIELDLLNIFWDCIMKDKYYGIRQKYVFDKCHDCAAYLECFFDHELGEIYNLCEIDKTSIHYLDTEKYLSETLGVIPMAKSMKIVNSFNEKMAILDLLVKHCLEKHNFNYCADYLRTKEKFYLKIYLNKQGLLIPWFGWPGIRIVESDDMVNSNPVRSRINDCNYFISPINVTASKVLNCLDV